MKKISSSQIITLLATIVTITVNILANALPLNGQGTGEISDRFAIYFVPAGYVFAIWGLIYIGMIAYSIYQALPAQRENTLLKKIAPAYWVGSAANTAWIFLWHYEFFPLTLAAMLILLASLLVIYRQISAESDNLSPAARWSVKLTFSVYLGWISVATIANFSQVLNYINWSGWGISAINWTLIMLGTATLLGLLMQWRENDSAYALVLVWALYGIYVSQAGTPIVANAALYGAILLALAAVAFPVVRRSAMAKAR